jgi:hypothetical protein
MGSAFMRVCSCTVCFGVCKRVVDIGMPIYSRPVRTCVNLDAQNICTGAHPRCDCGALDDSTNWCEVSLRLGAMEW